jgi:PadR family transcriptional regulator, regulatory protein PadR
LPNVFNRFQAKYYRCSKARSPALHRLEQQGWIRAKWAASETGREAKFYSLTAGGRKHLEAEAANWKRLSEAINLVVETA